jgi:hypothetical protein
MARLGLAIPVVAGVLTMGGGATAAPVNFVEVTVKIGEVRYDTLVLDAGEFNADGRLENRFEVYACDGSVNLLQVACDGSVREAIQIGVSATANPGITSSVQATGQSKELEIAVAFGIGFLLDPGVWDLTLEGTYEFERLRNPDLPNFAGNLTIGPWDEFLANPDTMLSGRVEGETRVKLGSDVKSLLAGVLETSGPVTSGAVPTGFSQIVCPAAGCGQRAQVISFSTHNPDEVLRRVKVSTTLKSERGTLQVIPLPAAGWLLLGGLAGLGLLRRRPRHRAA